MKRILFILLGVLILFSLLSGAGYGVFMWRFSAHVPAADYPEPANALAARLQDLDYLRRLPEADKSFSNSEIAALNAHIDGLEARADSLTDAQFLMEVAAAVAITENGHTNSSRFTTMNRLNSLPARFFWFGDGLHIVRAHAEHEDLIGARVIAYEGAAPEALYPQLDRYFGGNDAFLRTNSAYHFAAPAALHAVGLIDQPDTVTLELVGRDGATFTRTLTVEEGATALFGVSQYPIARPHERETESGHDWRFLNPAMTEATWFGRHPDQLMWTDTLNHGGVYWRMRDVFGDEATPLPDWIEQQAERLRDNPARYLVLDLRSNGGGDYTRTMGVARKIGELVEPGGRIYVLTNGGTFSAAVVTAAFALYGGGENAILTGEPMGDDAQFWAESAGVMRLPNSDIPIFLSTAYHDWENGCSDWSRCFWINILFGVAAGPLDVELSAPLLFSDYAQGIDSGVEAILAAEAARADTPAP